MSNHKTRKAISVIGMILLTGTFLAAYIAWAKEARPFWTEKSAFVEGEDLFVVGVASKARSVEEGRRHAFEQGKVELMNYAQVTSLEAQGLVVETQMTFEEANPDGSFTVYRLLRVPASKLVSIQGRLQAQSRAHENTLEQSRKELIAVQQTLTEKAIKLDQQQRKVEQMLQQINEKLQLKSTPGNRSESGASLVDHVRATEAKLDAREQELDRLYRQVKERIKSSSQNACRYVTPGMTPSEVRSVVGGPDGEVFSASDNHDTWAYGNTSVHFNGAAVVSGVSGCPR